MTNAIEAVVTTGERRFVTFYVDQLLIGLDIDQVQEINRQFDLTTVPRSPSFVRGVINLRGEVVTVIDLRRVLQMPEAELTKDSRNLIIQSDGEIIGLWVDQIADILNIPVEEVSPSPANVSGVDGRYFQGVHALENEIVVILDIAETLAG
ncbi:MAG: chemotaxis protein CheW [Pirellulaceae bacterium]|jgi:purine-binding chemotaxis protein CheW|nr:chemotaxis protein CheW [Pirellulaceae bacterium]MDP7015245.1 chemotaxis protein CheW [Pirellulaceae bacterium]